MKWSRRNLLILAACGAGAAVVIMVWRQEREPSYQGRTLSEWLRAYRQPFGAHAPVVSNEAADAVRHIGTNGLPFLVRWIQDAQKLSWWRERLFSKAYSWNLASRARGQVLEAVAGRELLAGRAFWGFVILGPEARSAIPDLVRVANGGNEASAQLATAALGYMGKDALPPLLTLATNKQVGSEALMAIGHMGYVGTNAHPAVIFLIQCLEDRELSVGAADILGRLGLESDISVPALAMCLQSTNQNLRTLGVISLGKFGEEARAVVPELLKTLDDPDTNVRDAATNALRQIAPEVLRKEGSP